MAAKSGGGGHGHDHDDEQEQDLAAVMMASVSMSGPLIASPQRTATGTLTELLPRTIP